MRKPSRDDLTGTPHDALIKRTFGDREHAAGLLRAALAPEIVAIIDFRTLAAEKIHFVDRGLRGRYADLLFSARMDHDRVYVHVLIEHQSKVEPLMVYRMGAYMWRRWDQLVRDEPARTQLPVIIPILIHHSASGWTAATSFEDVIAIPSSARAALLPYVPRFQMKLVDVSHEPAGGLTERALTDLGRLVLWCLSIAGDDARLKDEIDRFVAELNAVYTRPDARDAIVTLVRYLMATHRHLTGARISSMLVETAKKGQKEVDMDVLDELREEWTRDARREAAREAAREGERKGRTATLLEQLAARFGAVPRKVRAQILAADEKALSRWSIRLLTATTLAEVLDDSASAKRAAAAAKRVVSKRPVARKPARVAK